MFAYAGQNPASSADPYGLFDWRAAARGAGRAALYVGGGVVVAGVVVWAAPAWITGSAVATALGYTAAVGGAGYLGWETGQLITGEDIGYRDGGLATRQICEEERSERIGAAAVGWATLGLAATARVKPHDSRGGVSLSWGEGKNFRVEYGRLPNEGRAAKRLPSWIRGKTAPHYHRRGPGGIGRHRPYQSTPGVPRWKVWERF